MPIAHHFSPYFGVTLGRTAYAVQDNTIRAKYSPRVFTNLTDSVVQEVRKERNPSSSISGRLVNLGTVSGGMSKGGIDSDKVPLISGISKKIQEIQTHSATTVRMTGTGLGSSKLQNVNPSLEKKRNF